MNHLVRGLVFDESNNQHRSATFYSVAGTARDTSGKDPVPELPTIILLAVGLVVLAGYVYVVRKMRKGR